MKTLIGCLALVAVICFQGCSARPNFGAPGTIYHQRNQAVLHDPFPERESGPTIEGARPMGYDLPRPEPKRSQTNPYARRNATGY